MLYNEPITYSQTGFSYIGDLLIYAPSIETPILLNNITFFFPTSEDYSNLTTISVISIDTSSQGIVIIEAYENQLKALMDAKVIAITGQGEIAIDPTGIYDGQTRGLIDTRVIETTAQAQITIDI
jgi:hypothetical protein